MKFVIFHGAFGSKDGNWFPWLKTELKKLNQEVILEQFPCDDYEEITQNGPDISSKNQNLTNWLKVFEKNILPKINKKDALVFIGHSLAPVFILHLADKYNLRLNSAIFVSPFLTFLHEKGVWQFDHVNSSFYKIDFDFEKLKTQIPNSYVVYGNDDPYVDKKFPLDFAKKINSKVIVVKNGGHLNEEFGYTKFPLILNLCKDVIGKNS